MNRIDVVIEPSRADSLLDLLRRVKRAAEARNVPFLYEVGETETVDYGPAYEGDQMTKREVRKTYIQGPKEGASFTDDEGVWHPPTAAWREAARWMRQEAHMTVEYGDLTNSEWEAIATVEPMTGDLKKGGVALVKAVPSLSEEAEAALDGNHPDTYTGGCDHCGTNRRRTDTIMVFNRETKEVRNVGRSCLFEYTGIDPDLLTKLYDIEKTSCGGSWGDGGWWGYRNSWTYDLSHMTLLCVAAFVKRGAYIKGFGGLMFSEGFTYSKVGQEWWFGYTDFEGKFHKQQQMEWSDDGPTERVMVVAGEVMEYLSNLDPNSSYERTLKAVHEVGAVGKKEANFAASAFAGWQNMKKRQMWEKEKEARDAERVEAGESSIHYPAHEKERVAADLMVTVTMTRAIDSQWGPSTLIVMQPDKHEGATLKWFATASGKGYRPTVGERVILRAFTVKRHGEYRGVKETLINRAVIDPIEG